mmetsp:Transcript_37439/g.112261  ORF Transcript_37439/g.112261 Transcript_37439/m.112261 type:complete len:207 (+) Transcript_37439:713-1333(+)
MVLDGISAPRRQKDELGLLLRKILVRPPVAGADANAASAPQESAPKGPLGAGDDRQYRIVHGVIIDASREGRFRTSTQRRAPPEGDDLHAPQFVRVHPIHGESGDERPLRVGDVHHPAVRARPVQRLAEVLDEGVHLRRVPAQFLRPRLGQVEAPPVVVVVVLHGRGVVTVVDGLAAKELRHLTRGLEYVGKGVGNAIDEGEAGAG